MAETVYIYHCPPGAQGTAQTLGGDTYPTCDSGQGSWQAVTRDSVGTPWYALQIPEQQVADLLGASILFLAVCWVAKKASQAMNP